MKNIQRCAWVSLDKPLYVAYHDEEWGKPVHSDIKHFEMLILEGAQAGLSWYSILKRRDNYRLVFKGFDPHLVSSMKDEELEALLLDDRIIRNRLKIFSTRKNAQVFIAIQKEFGSFDTYVWSFVLGKPLINFPESMDDVQNRSPESDALSIDLKKRGMSFVGSTIIYAYMQAVGLVNDHFKSCAFKRC